MTVTKKIINLAAAPIIVIIALFIAYSLVKSKKTPPPQKPNVAIANIQVIESYPSSVRPNIHTFGNTQSYLETNLSSQVGGEVIELSSNFEAGKAVSKGDWLVRINQTDYLANLANRKSSLASAKQSLAEEQTRSRLAQEDWKASGRDIADASDFTLRKPQLIAAQASVEAAQSAVDQAMIDLERTTITSPFNAIIETRSTSLGNVVNANSILGKLIARERIEVRLPITPKQAVHLQLPRFDSNTSTLSAELTTPSVIGTSWQATITRAEATVDTKNQTIYLIGEIKAPFDNKNAFLPIGAFVNATIIGNALESVHTLPEVAVVDDEYAWIVSPDNTLAKQPLEIAFSLNGEILAHIESPRFELPLKIAARPLASFKEGLPVAPIVSETP